MKHSTMTIANAIVTLIAVTICIHCHCCQSSPSQSPTSSPPKPPPLHPPRRRTTRTTTTEEEEEKEAEAEAIEDDGEDQEEDEVEDDGSLWRRTPSRGGAGRRRQAVDSEAAAGCGVVRLLLPMSTRVGTRSLPLPSHWQSYVDCR